MIYIILLILIILIISAGISNRENFNFQKIPVSNVCYHRPNYSKKIFNYQNEILYPGSFNVLKIGNKKKKESYFVLSLLINNKEVSQLIKNIPKHNEKKKYIEIKNGISNIYSNKYGTKFKIKKLEEYMKNIEDKTISIIKNYLENKKEQCKKNSHCIVKLYKHSLIKIEQSEQDLRLHFTFEITVLENYYSFIFYSIIEIVNNKIHLNHLSIKGNRSADKLELLPGIEKSNNLINIYVNPLNTEYRANYTYYRDSDEKVKYIKSDEYNKEFLKKRDNEYTKDYQCIGKKAFNKFECEQDKNELQQKTKPGIWDRKCRYDIECPFYMKNRNYPNRRGGCIKGNCDFPLGIKKISFRKYDKQSLPKCYNCSNNSKNCCEEQKNKKIFPKLDSPDYKFENDFKQRYKFKDILSKKQLKIL